MLAFALTTYAFMEMSNYKKYNKKYSLFNKFRNIQEFPKELLDRKIDIVCDDIKNNHVETSIFMKEMFGGTDIKNVTKHELHNAIIDNLFLTSSKNVNYEKVDSVISALESHLNHEFEENHHTDKKVGHISVGADKLIAWYRPLAFDIFLKFLKMPSKLYFTYVLGFERHVIDNSIVVWIKKGSVNNDLNATLFLPACIGGIIFYPYFVSKLDQTRTIFILEIPGMSWNGYNDAIPPNMSKIANGIINTISKHNIKNLDIVGHSFGTIVISHIANECYHLIKQAGIKINKVVYVEGLLFYVRAFKTLGEIDKSLYEVITGSHPSDIFTMALFPRDLYVKFYIKRYLMLSNSVLCGESQMEKECNIHAVMGKHDNKFITKDYVDYIDKKKLQIKYKVFDHGIHGSFVWDSDIQQHVLDILNK